MKPLSDRTLERYLLGELPEDRTKEVAGAAAADPAVAARLEALRRSDAEILERYPPAMIAARIGERLAPRRRLPALGWLAVPAAAAAALLFVVLAPLRDAGDSTRIKGLAPGRQAGLVLHRKAGAGVEPLADGGRAAAGDVIQISYVAGGARYGAIFSVDGAGSVTWHLPPAPAPRAESPAVQAGGEVPLGFAYELDDAPDFERFFFVTSAKPFTLEALDREARRLAGARASARTERPRLSKDLALASFLLVKEARR